MIRDAMGRRHRGVPPRRSPPMDPAACVPVSPRAGLEPGVGLQRRRAQPRQATEGVTLVDVSPGLGRQPVAAWSRTLAAPGGGGATRRSRTCSSRRRSSRRWQTLSRHPASGRCARPTCATVPDSGRGVARLTCVWLGVALALLADRRLPSTSSTGRPTVRCAVALLGAAVEAVGLSFARSQSLPRRCQTTVAETPRGVILHGAISDTADRAARG